MLDILINNSSTKASCAELSLYVYIGFCIVSLVGETFSVFYLLRKVKQDNIYCPSRDKALNSLCDILQFLGSLSKVECNSLTIPKICQLIRHGSLVLSFVSCKLQLLGKARLASIYDLLFLITYLFCFNGSLAGPVWLARLYLNHNAVLIVIAEHSLPFLAQSQSNQSVAE